jgi:DNA-binding GntR family transcriptional regulator
MRESTYDILVERILLGDYLPGTNLVEQEIAEELGVSRTPVREALLRLKVEGLIRIIPRGGIFVAEASIQRVKEVTEVRLVLEEYLGRVAVERCSQKLLSEYEEWLRNLEPKWNSLSSREWMQRDGEFHAFMDRAAANQTLCTQLTLLRQQAVLFWGQSTDGGSSHVFDSLKDIVGDFRSALDALQKRDGERCSMVLRQHVLDHVERIQEYMKPDLLTLAG